MNFKTKAFGFIAGAALSLSLITGVMANPGTSVTLQNGAACTTGTVTATDFTFASATYTGTNYAGGGAATAGTLVVPVTNAVYGVSSCKVTITVSELKGSIAGNTDVIPASAVTLTDNGSNSVNVSGNITVPQNSSVTLNASLNLTGVTAQPDTYTGTITVGNASASN